MKTLRIISTTLIVALLSLTLSQGAQAGQVNGTGVSVTWDDSALYKPANNSCSRFAFNVALDSSIWQVSLSIKNKFGDVVGGPSSIYGSGQVSIQVCSGRDLTGAVLVAEAITHKVVTSIYEQPISFLSRTTSPAPAVSTAPPSPVSSTPSVKVGTALCVNRKNFNVRVAPASLRCPKGTVLRALG